MLIFKNLHFISIGLFFKFYFCQKEIIIFNGKYKELSCLCPDSDVYVVQNIFDKKK
jgi:hypothetical protein